ATLAPGSSQAPGGARSTAAGSEAGATTGRAAVLVRAVGELPPGRAAAYEELAAEALRRVEALWGEHSVHRPVRVLLPADAAGFAELTGHAVGERAVPASTVGTGPGARVVVHPQAWGRLTPEGRQA